MGTVGLSRQPDMKSTPETPLWQSTLRVNLAQAPMPLQILVATDAFYEVHLEEFTEVVAEANARSAKTRSFQPQILVAGRIKPEVFERAQQHGLNAALFAGANIFEILQQCLKRIGVDL
jgi:hypothetical protein